MTVALLIHLVFILLVFAVVWWIIESIPLPPPIGCGCEGDLATGLVVIVAEIFAAAG